MSYLVFGGNYCSEEQGWRTFRGRFPTEAQAEECVANFYSDWWQIVRFDTQEIVKSGVTSPRKIHHDWCPNCMANL